MIKLYLTKKVKKERELKNQALEENKILKDKLKYYYKFIKSIAAEVLLDSTTLLLFD